MAPDSLALSVTTCNVLLYVWSCKTLAETASAFFNNSKSSGLLNTSVMFSTGASVVCASSRANLSALFLKKLLMIMLLSLIDYIRTWSENHV